MKINEILGDPSPLPDNIPSNSDILRFFLKRQIEVTADGKSCSNDYIFRLIAPEIRSFYEQKSFVSSLTTVNNIKTLV